MRRKWKNKNCCGSISEPKYSECWTKCGEDGASRTGRQSRSKRMFTYARTPWEKTSRLQESKTRYLGYLFLQKFSPSQYPLSSVRMLWQFGHWPPDLSEEVFRMLCGWTNGRTAPRRPLHDQEGRWTKHLSFRCETQHPQPKVRAKEMSMTLTECTPIMSERV